MLETWLWVSRVRLPTVGMVETWLREQGSRTVLISSANLYRIITLPFSTLTTP